MCTGGIWRRKVVRRGVHVGRGKEVHVGRNGVHVGRGVEQAMLSWLGTHAIQRGRDHVAIPFVPTPPIGPGLCCSQVCLRSTRIAVAEKTL